METNINKTARVSKIVLYAISVCLVVFYCLDLLWGFMPNVGIEYKMYYITHELSDWPGYGNLKYHLGTKEICIERNEETLSKTQEAICARKGQGFEKPSKDGTKVNAKDSYIYYLPDESKTEAYFEINVSEFSGQEVEVYANDTFVGKFGEKGIHRFKTEKIVKDELLTIHFGNESCEYTLYSVMLGQ